MQNHAPFFQQKPKINFSISLKYSKKFRAKSCGGCCGDCGIGLRRLLCGLLWQSLASVLFVWGDCGARQGSFCVGFCG
ncbi:hypothetical protein BCM31_02745 [Helicobacter winghamensis]|uniref:Uncharacterized protein n=1 Tax=Helicobacter winghamensis TaxID=157268 RepID=A0A2N3PK56_9HELI|nr:hypothetical protein BCM31_02745 [Helicobacter winghamensis]